MTAAETRALAHRYFQSWQEPADFATFRECLADDLVFDFGTGRIEGGDTLTRVTRETESPWREIHLLASMAQAGEAVLFYEGIDRRSGVRHRVAEYLTVTDLGITRILAAICPLRTED